MVDQGGLRDLIAVLPGAVRALRADVMLNPNFVADKVHADPVFQIDPFPFENHLPDRRVLGEQHTALPGWTRLLFALFHVDGCSGCICDIAPDGSRLCVFDFELFIHDAVAKVGI